MARARKPNGPKILTLDLETSPNIAHTWGLWEQTVSLSQLIEPSRVISFAAKWHGKPTVIFKSEFHDSRKKMVEAAWQLLDEADAVVTYNGNSFDIPHLNREFALVGMTLPSPFKSIDLCRVVKGRFRFVSNKLDHVAQQLGLGSKVHHSGHSLWVQCLQGDAKAWALMRKYNIGDTRLTERLYDKLRPWIKGHPHHGLYSGKGNCCQQCGSAEMVKRGIAYTATGSFQQFRCKDCGTWLRGAKRINGVETRSV